MPFREATLPPLESEFGSGDTYAQWLGQPAEPFVQRQPAVQRDR
jgi:hypothetical protein